MSRTARIVCIVAACVLAGLPVRATRAESIGSVEIKKADVRRFATLCVGVDETIPLGFVREVNAPEGKSFLVIWLDLKVTPGKDEDGDEFTNIEENDIRLLDEKGNAYPAIGHCTRDGRLNLYTSSFTVYGKPDRETYPYDLVFAPPNAGGAWMLKFGATEYQLMAPANPEATLDRVAIATFKLDRIEVLEKIESTEEVGPFDGPQDTLAERVKATTSKFLRVRLLVKPRAANDIDGFQFAAGDIGVVYGAQVYTPPIGYFENGEFYPGDYTYRGQPDAVGDFPAIEAQLVFPLPGRITKFRVLYLARPVAEGDVPK